MAIKRSLRERFEEKYIPEPNSGCWLWTAACLRNGYGKIWVNASTRLASARSRTVFVFYIAVTPLDVSILSIYGLVHMLTTPLIEITKVETGGQN